ncbi:MAG: hypothetical protein K2G55_01565 [Lachnospiraceae bacterium]|nr:hypothetical protein [Lachnospiraceae bacterium]MDE7204188.1 hypothetical protein [Lachnospiraceae bacterium]
MITHNASVDNFIEYIKDKDIYIYGVGDFYRRLSRKVIYRDIHKRVVGYIDNGKKGEMLHISGQEYSIHGVDFLKSVKSGIVLLCGTTYLDEMYRQLISQDLSDEIECFIMPLIWLVSDGKDDPEIASCLNRQSHSQPIIHNRIEKKIHCFWFSGEKKPEKYQKCIDTWKCVCPDYEIIEWNAGSYDYGKNLFVKQAYEKKKWAFVSDYARLDVIYHYGGIYLDMDVELIKDFSPFLKFDAFFNYGVRHLIELGSGFGSVKHNSFIGSLLKSYEDVAFLDKDGKSQTEKFVQPVWLNQRFCEEGFWMNGDMQLLNNMLLLPRRFYTPKDDLFLCNYLQCEETRGIHHFNSEWKPQEYLEHRQKNSSWIAVIDNLISQGREVNKGN